MCSISKMAFLYDSSNGIKCTLVVDKIGEDWPRFSPLSNPSWNRFTQGLEMLCSRKASALPNLQTLSVCSNMRYNKVTLVRPTCTGHDQPAKALEFDKDIDLPHLVTTTNKEVDALNIEYIQTFAQAKESKIFNIPMPNKSMKMSSA